MDRAQREAHVLVAPVVVGDAEAAAVAAGIGGGGQLDDRGELGLHQVAAHLIRTIRQTTGVVVRGGAQQDLSAVHGTGGQHHHMGTEQPGMAIDLHLHGPHFGAAGIHVHPPHLGPLPHGHCAGLAGQINTEQFGITGGVQVGFRPAQGQVVGMAAVALEGNAQLLHERLHRPRSGWVIAAAGRLRGIHAGHTMNAVELFSPFVIGRQVGVADLPAGGGAVLQLHTGELLFTHALQHAPPDLGVATEGIDRLRREGIAIRAKPLLTGVITVFAEQIHIGHVLIGQGHGTATLQQQHGLAGGRQLPGKSATGSTAADHNHVVMVVVDDHG